jgi:hypothetical protein
MAVAGTRMDLDAAGLRRASAFIWRSATLARCCVVWGFAACPRARVIPDTMPPPRRLIKNFADLVTKVIAEHARGKPIELWWQEEARVGQQGTLTRLWARLTKGSVERSSMEWSDEGQRGSRPAAPCDCRYDWACIFGAVCPTRGAGQRWCCPTPTLKPWTCTGRDRPPRHARRSRRGRDGWGWVASARRPPDAA